MGIWHTPQGVDVVCITSTDSVAIHPPPVLLSRGNSGSKSMEKTFNPQSVNGVSPSRSHVLRNQDWPSTLAAPLHAQGGERRR